MPQVTDNFIGWGIPFPHFFTPLTPGIEFFGQLFLLLGLDEFEYLALFFWLAIAGADAVSLDHLLTKMTRRRAHA